MTTEVLEAWNAPTAEQLLQALQEALQMAKDDGFNASEVFANKRRLTLTREKLSDGSYTLNLNFFDGDTLFPPSVA